MTKQKLVVTVYTAGPSCRACTMTKRKLDDLGIAYDEIAIDSDPAITESALGLGLSTAPIVCAHVDGEEQYWDGYRPDRIEQLLAARC